MFYFEQCNTYDAQQYKTCSFTAISLLVKMILQNLEYFKIVYGILEAKCKG